jgi:Ethylbenzene dehydrogenase
MKRVLFVIAIAMGITLVSGACGGPAAQAPTPTSAPLPDNAMLATKTAAAPKDGADPAWSKTPPLVFTAKGHGDVEGGSVKVTSRALYSDSDIYMLFTWADSEASQVKTSWKYDGKTWSKQTGDEDRIALMWEITPIKDFSSKGCTIMCHTKAGSDTPVSMGVNSPTEKADLWHWKSYTSDPLGYADDYSVVQDDPSKPTTGRKADAGGGATVNNETQAKDKPAFVQDPTKNAMVAGYLLKDQTVDIKDYGVFKAGDTLAYRMLTPFTDSRGDIKATGAWKDGNWTVMLSRKLNTGHDDDVAFDPAKVYNLAAAVWNNAQNGDKFASGPLMLYFGK